jgi:hypothetical protein
MSKAVTAGTTAIVLLSATLALPTAQARPDLTGTWVMDLSRSESAKQNEPIGPTTVAIVQGVEDLVFTVTSGDKSATVTYRFDGRPSAVPGGTATSHWEGNALVTDMIRTISGQTVTTRETRRLSAGGDEMIVESVLVVQHGYTLSGTKNYGAGTDVFVKAR